MERYISVDIKKLALRLSLVRGYKDKKIRKITGVSASERTVTASRWPLALKRVRTIVVLEVTSPIQVQVLHRCWTQPYPTWRVLEHCLQDALTPYICAWRFRFANIIYTTQLHFVSSCATPFTWLPFWKFHGIYWTAWLGKWRVHAMGALVQSLHIRQLVN